MRELADALLDLNEHLQLLSTVVIDDVETVRTGADDVEAIEENPECGATSISAYEAAGVPFGPPLQARGVWHLFQQQTTCN